MSLEDELLFAAHSGKRKALDKFLKKHGSKVNINCTSNDGATPLIQCVQGARMAKDSNKNEYVQCCKRLIGAGADLNHRDHLGRTSLHWAVFYNKPDLVSELLDCGSDPKIRDDGGQNVLHFAIRVHAVECIQVLCDQVENEVLRESNNKGVPPIIYAVQQGHADSCEILLKAGVDINEIEDNNVSKTALHYSVEFNRLDLVQFLLSHEARVDIADASKLTVVDLSCICDDYHYLATIIDHLGDEKMSTLSAANDRGITPLMIACQKGNTQQVSLIIKEGAPIASTDRKGKTALHYTVENKEPDCAVLLLQSNHDIADIRDRDGHTALHLATIGANKKLISVLIKYADINGTDHEKHTPVHWATVCGHGELIEFLIQNGANASLPDVHDAYPMHYAAQMCGDPQVQHIGLRCLKSLISNKAAFNCMDNNGRQPLLWAASAGSSAACQMLANAGADVEAIDKDKLTALHCAASRGHAQCVQTLVIDCQCNVDPPDKNGCTPLFYSITLGHCKCVSILLEFHADTSMQDAKGRTPVHCAASKGNLSCLKLLVAAKAPLNMANKNGNHPIHEAIHKGHIDVVQYLLEFGCDPNSANKIGMTGLHQAAATNNEGLCKMMIDAGANVNFIMTSEKYKYVTPLDYAIDRESNECIELLKSVGARKGSDITNDAAIIIGRNYKRLVNRKLEEEKEKEKEQQEKEQKETKNGKKKMKKKSQGQKDEFKKGDLKQKTALQTNVDKRNDEVDNSSEIVDGNDVSVGRKTSEKHVRIDSTKNTEKDEDKKDKKISPYLAPQPWMDRTPAVRKSATGYHSQNGHHNDYIGGNYESPRSKYGKSRTESCPNTPRDSLHSWNRANNNNRTTKSAGPRMVGGRNPRSSTANPGKRRFPQGLESKNEKQKTLVDIYFPAVPNGRGSESGRDDERSPRSPRSGYSHSQRQGRINPIDVEKDIEKKMDNWDNYLQREMSFLDEVIRSNLPAFDELRDEAERYKGELMRGVNVLKAEVDINTKKLQEELRKNEEKDNENMRKYEEEIQEGLEKAERTFKRVSSNARIISVESQQENDKQDEDLSKVVSVKRPTLEQWLRRKTMDYHSPRYNDDEYEDLDDYNEMRRSKHEEWIRKKNEDYRRKKQALRTNNVHIYSSKISKVNRPITSYRRERTPSSLDTRPSTSNVTHEDTFDLRAPIENGERKGQKSKSGLVRMESYQYQQNVKDKKLKDQRSNRTSSQMSTPTSSLSPRQSLSSEGAVTGE